MSDVTLHLVDLFLLGAFFLLAAAGDWLSVRWHEAREARRVGRVVGISMVLEVLTWIPILALVIAEDWRIAAVSVAGSGAGAWWGMRRASGIQQARPAQPHPANRQ